MAAPPDQAVRPARSAVAAAAYRSGETLYDLSQKRSFSFHKPDVVHKEIMAPEGAAAWVYDRAALWNFVEKAEKRYDAQLMREVELTLPRELTLPQQIALVRTYVGPPVRQPGDGRRHWHSLPKAADGLDQPHAHVSLTLRRLDPTSVTGFAATKERDWNETEEVREAVAEARKRYNNTGLAEDKAALEAAEAKRNINVWRAAWAQAANAALEAAGSEARIDHRTLEKQGDLPHAAALSRRRRAAHRKGLRLSQGAADPVDQRQGAASLYAELQHYQRRDPAKVVDLRVARFRHGRGYGDELPPPAARRSRRCRLTDESGSDFGGRHRSPSGLRGKSRSAIARPA